MILQEFQNGAYQLHSFQSVLVFLVVYVGMCSHSAVRTASDEKAG